MDIGQIQLVLNLLGAGVPTSSRLYLVGGSALALLGSPRQTIDIDFIGDDLSPSELHQTILKIARKEKILMDAVAIERFIPLPDGSQERVLRIGQFGNLEVFVADPYSIALSKLDRGFDYDFDDLVFLIQNKFVDIGVLETVTSRALVQARDFDMDPAQVIAHIQELKRRLG